jgi:hypothetical protein
MSTSSQHSFSSVLSVNPYKDTYFNSVSSFITESKNPEFSKDQFVISYLNTKEFITAQIEISKNIPDEDLFDAINNKAYDELALDQAVEYHIQYIETFNNLDEDNRHFHIFIVDPLDLTTTFEKVVEKVKYIDVVVPAPLLIKSLYSKEILESSGVHCFIYFQENDASITIYGNKEFIYTKSIKYSFIDMHERFCELYGERVTYDNFMDFFTTVNLKESDSEYKEYLIRLYKELIANINDILTYAKRAFEIEKFEYIYTGTQVQTETKLHEMLEVELNIHANEFNFDCGFETSEDLYLDQMHALMQLYTLVPAAERYECNFTTYRRPPKFIRRESGKLIILTAAAFALAFAYPITYWILTYVQELQVDLLKQEYKEVHNIKITREATIRNRRADKEKALTLLAQEKKEYNDKKNTLIKIHEVKVDYPMKAKLITSFTKDINKFKVNVKSIIYAEANKKGKVLTLNLVSRKDREITKLVEYLTKTKADKYDFDLEKIQFDEKLKLYQSELKVKLL